MPKIFAKDHTVYMTNYLKLGKEEVLNKKRTVFLVDHEGYMFPVAIYVKFNPNVMDGINYIGLLRILPIDCISYIILRFHLQYVVLFRWSN